MKKFFLALVVAVSSYSAHSFPYEETDTRYCQEYLNWHLSKLKEELLPESIERVHKKLELAFQAAYSEFKGINIKKNEEFIRLSHALAKFDQQFETLLKQKTNYKFLQTFYKKRLSADEELSIYELTYAWREFQQARPELFQSIKPEHLLNEWDLYTADSIKQLSDLNFEEKTKYDSLVKDFFTPEKLLESSEKDFLQKTEEASSTFDQNEKKFSSHIKEILMGSLDDYKNICGDHKSLNFEMLSCIGQQDEKSFLSHKNLDNLSSLLTVVNVDMAKPVLTEKVVVSGPEPEPEPEPEDPLKDIVIEKPNYKTNDAIATFCKRDPSIANTIVIHHTATTTNQTPQSLNNMHLQRKSGSEHWYMLGYNYLVTQGSYQNDSEIKLVEGRPIDMSGSHAGGMAKLDKETKALVEKAEITCGSHKKGFTTESMKERITNNEINANITTVGISIVGNYSPKKYVRRGGVTVLENETGYDPKGGIRYPSENLLKETAKLACSLQKQYPRLKTLKPHQFFKSTDCPGSVRERMKKIADYAKEFSCEFSL